MLRRTVWLGVALAAQLAACRAAPHQVNSQAEAIEVAKKALTGQPGGTGPFHVVFNDGTWTVTANTVDRGSTSVAILAKTGMTTTFTSDLPDPTLAIPAK